jgi:xanthine dehydrogenase molybdopterin-binding subunit B
VFLYPKGEVHLGGQEHFYMETQSVRVVPKGEDKEMDIYVSSQDAAFTQVGSSTQAVVTHLTQR